jgi:hypothetical protein
MKLCFLCLFALACVAASHQRRPDAITYPLGPLYALVAVTDDMAFLELRKCQGDSIIDSVTICSRYMPPDFDLEDVVLGSEDEFLIRTRGGGTGIAETHLEVYGVVGNRIRRFGDFVVDRQAESWPDSDHHEKLSGKVSFPKKGELIYRYTETIRKGGKSVTKSVTERYAFNSKQMEYEPVRKP